MRQFGSSGFRLWNIGADAKTLYTAFCLLTFLGVVSSALYYRELVGVGTSGIRRYYAGENDEPEPPPPSTPQPTEPTTGPAIEVPPEGAETRRPIVVAVSYRKLLEVTHFHLFTMPVVLLIVGHLFLATGLSDRAKRAWLIAGRGQREPAPRHAVVGPGGRRSGAAARAERDRADGDDVGADAVSGGVDVAGATTGRRSARRRRHRRGRRQHRLTSAARRSGLTLFPGLCYKDAS